MSDSVKYANLILTRLHINEIFILKVFIKEFVIPQKNNNSMDQGNVILNVDFLVCIVMGLIMANIRGFQRCYFVVTEKSIPLRLLATNSMAYLFGTDFRK